MVADTVEEEEDVEVEAAAEVAAAAAVDTALISEGRRYRGKGVEEVVLLLSALALLAVVAEKGGERFEEENGGRCSRDDLKEGIVSRVPCLVAVEIIADFDVGLKFPVAPVVQEELQGCRELNVCGPVVEEAACVAAAAVVDEVPPVLPPTTASLAPPPLPPPLPSRPPPALSPSPALAVGLAVDAAATDAIIVVLAHDFVEGSP